MESPATAGGPTSRCQDIASQREGVAPSTMMPPPRVAPATTAKPSSPSRVIETAVSETEGTGQELSVDDYLVGGVTMFDAQTGLPPASKWNDLCY
jgi:hypothetical protein